MELLQEPSINQVKKCNTMKKINQLLLCTFIFLSSCSKKNNLELIFADSLNKKDFKIEMEVLGSNTAKKVIFDGKKEYNILKEYGENEWYFTYKDSLYAYFRHFKSNRNDCHNYKYLFSKKNNTISVEIAIDGISKVKRNIIFTPIPHSR